MTDNKQYNIVLEVFYPNTAGNLALPKEIQDLIDEQDAFEMNNQNLSPQILVETAIRWLNTSIEKAQKNPRLVNRPEETARKLLDLARQFACLKE